MWKALPEKPINKQTVEFRIKAANAKKEDKKVEFMPDKHTLRTLFK